MESPETLLQYRRLLSRAFTSADDFRGTERQSRDLLSNLILMEEFLRAHGDGAVSNDLEERFAREASVYGIHSIDALLGHASSRAWGVASTAETFEQRLAALVDSGVLLTEGGTVFIPADEGPTINDPADSGVQAFEIHEEPRLIRVIEFLQSRGIYTDDIILRVGGVAPNSLRRNPYVIVEIPRANIQIAVCDQKGEALFVSSTLLKPSIWATTTKSALRAMPNVACVHFNRRWRESVGAFLDAFGRTNAGAKINREKLEARLTRVTAPLTTRDILGSANAHIDATGQRPSTDAELVCFGPLKGEVWRNIHRAIGLRRRTLGEADLPESVTGLPSFLDYYGVRNPKRIVKRDKVLSVAAILEAARDHQSSEGAWPTRKSGAIEHGILKGWDWSHIEEAIGRRNSGIDNEMLADEIRGLASLLEYHGLSISKHSSKKRITIDSLVQTLDENRTLDGRLVSFVNVRSSVIENGPHKGERWDNLSNQISKRQRGLAAANLPAEVKGTTSFAKWAVEAALLAERVEPAGSPSFPNLLSPDCG